MTRPGASALVELVRMPAALTVPGDTLAGAAAAGRPLVGRVALLPAASICLYWAGMALNDYADHHLDARERPERPIPSGRVSPRQALGLAAGLTVGGLGLARLAGGRAGLVTASALATTVWAYDLLLKDTAAGPAAMAAARSLDVVLGAGSEPAAALVPAALLGLHTAGVTALSRGEVHGASVPAAAAVVTGTVTVGLLAGRRGRSASSHVMARDSAMRRVTPGLAGWFAASVGSAQARTVASPDAATVRAATGAGIRGMLPLQSTLVAGSGRPLTALALLALGPIVKVASKVVSPT